MIPSIETKRLLLRPYRREDADLVAHYLNDFDISGNLARVPHPYTREDAEMWVQVQFANPDPAPGATSFAIEVKGEGYAGAVGFHPGDLSEPVLGYWLAKPHWGKGVMSEATRAARDWIVAVSRPEQVLSGAFPFNTASLAIQRKLGFVETGRSSVHCLARGEDIEHIDTTLTRAGYDALRADEETRA